MNAKRITLAAVVILKSMAYTSIAGNKNLVLIQCPERCPETAE